MAKALTFDITPKLCKICDVIIRYKKGEGYREWSKKKTCSRECYFKWNTKERHGMWNGGVKHRPDGYLRDSNTDKYLHRLVIEQHIGRTLTDKEIVHHLDENPGNNNIENLIILTQAEHAKHHSKFRRREENGRFSFGH